MGKKDYRRDKKLKAARRNRIVWITVAIVVILACIGGLIFALWPSNQKPADSNAPATSDDTNNGQSSNQGNTEVVVPVADGKYAEADSSSDYVKINVSFTDANHEQRTGDIVIRLRPDCAPITVANFKKLVSEGYYNGTEFFRIMKGFMIQGGENENLDADYIKGEFSDNGVDNPLKHERGTISMARRAVDYDVPAYDSASSGFFIVDETSERNTLSLDGMYAAFGSVVFGIENVDNIATQELVYSEKYQDTVYPEHPVIVNNMTFVTPVE